VVPLGTGSRKSRASSDDRSYAGNPRATGPGHFWYTGQFGGGLIPSIVIARNGARGLTDDTPYNHYSLLRTIEQVWNLGYLGYAADGANVSSMTRLLQH